MSAVQQATELWTYAAKRRDLGHYAEARDAYLVLAGIKPHGAILWFNVARCSEILGDFEAAKHAFRQALDAYRTHPNQPDEARSYFGMGCCLFRLGDTVNGEAFWRDGLTKPLASPNGIFERSQVKLCLGMWEEGWIDFEGRKRLIGYQGSIKARIGDMTLPPEWDGKAQGKVLVIGGMGAGDVIQFSRYMMEVADVAGWKVRPALAGGGPLQRFLGYDGRTNGCDYWCALDSLPLLLRMPEPITPFHIAPWHRHSNTPPRVGVCWKGSASHTNDKDRSSPIDFRNVFQDERWELVSLQAGEGFDPKDYQETADLMRTLDAVVTVDTSTVHLAGTLGVPTICIPPTCPEYRWGIRGDTSPWYPSVKLVRRTRWDAWPEAIERAKTQLMELLR